MAGFIEGSDRTQSTMFPECLEDWFDEDNPVRVIDVFVDELNLGSFGFERVAAASTGRPGYHSSILLKLYVYGYLSRVQSSRRLEREAGRNVQVMWLTERLVPDHKTTARPSARFAASSFPCVVSSIYLLKPALRLTARSSRR